MYTAILAHIGKDVSQDNPKQYIKTGSNLLLAVVNSCELC